MKTPRPRPFTAFVSFSCLFALRLAARHGVWWLLAIPVLTGFGW
ncbi:hypothetical protein [Winogradskya consettensis]|nr:hypothetical protein [Actinoplanes consettensis]